MKNHILRFCHNENVQCDYDENFIPMGVNSQIEGTLDLNPQVVSISFLTIVCSRHPANY